VASRQPFVVSDAREHPLVRENLAIRDLGVIAYAGIPLTTKDHREVAVVTAHEKVDWAPYADDRTLVILSGVNQIGEIAKALVAAGRDADTPVAMTRVGTTTEQTTAKRVLTKDEVVGLK